MLNCLYEASIQKTAKECNCTPAFFIEWSPNNLPPCEGHTRHCMAKIFDDIGSERHILDNGKQKECLAACHDQTHKFLVTSAAFPNQKSFHHTEDFCLVLTKLRTSCGNEKKYSLDEEYPELCLSLDLAKNLTCDNISGEMPSDDTTISLIRKLRKEVR